MLRFEDEDGLKYTVNGVMMFRTGVAPKWEDPVNKEGGEWKIDVGVRDDATLQKIWELLVISPLTGEFPCAMDGLAGVRFIQKTKNQSLVTYRVEVWLKDGQKESPTNKAIYDFLDQKIIADILSHQDGMVPDIKWSAHR